MDATIKIWEIDTPNLKAILTGHSLEARSLVVLQNSNLVSGGRDGTIKVWNTSNFSLIRNINAIDEIWSLAVLQNGLLVSGSKNGTITIWDSDSGSLLRTIRGHASYVYSIAVLENGNLATIGQDTIIKIWNKNNGSLILSLFLKKKRELELNRDSDSGITWSLVELPRGFLASAGWSNIDIYNAANGRLARTLTGHTHWIHSLAVLSNGWLVSGSFDTSIKIWNTEAGYSIKTLWGHKSAVRSLVLLPNGYLASGSDDFTLKIWIIDNYLISTSQKTNMSDTQNLNPANCGQRPLLPSNKIVSGTRASPGDWGWKVIILSDDYPRTICSGSLINSQWVVTAANCAIE